MPRFHCPTPLQTGEVIALPAGAARHVQVLRMQPGGAITLFGGAERGGEFEATIEHMGRSEVRVLVGAHFAVEREPTRQVHLVVGVPANDRMDWLVEKATELGVASIQPVMTERSVYGSTVSGPTKNALIGRPSLLQLASNVVVTKCLWCMR